MADPHHAGYVDSEYLRLAAGRITEEELTRWCASLERIAAESGFFATLNHNLIAGRKP